MADYLHQRLLLEDGDVVEITSDTQANVILLTDSDYSAYRERRGYTYYGGFFTHFPAHLKPPYSGYWNVVLDLGGGSATVRTSFAVLKRR